MAREREVSKVSVLASWSLEDQGRRAHGVRFRLTGKLSEDGCYACRHTTQLICQLTFSPHTALGSHPHCCLRRQNQAPGRIRGPFLLENCLPEHTNSLGDFTPSMASPGGSRPLPRSPHTGPRGSISRSFQDIFTCVTCSLRVSAHTELLYPLSWLPFPITSFFQ